MTELCTVVMCAALAMDVPPFSINNFSYLQMNVRTPKAGVMRPYKTGRPAIGSNRALESTIRLTIGRSQINADAASQCALTLHAGE